MNAVYSPTKNIGFYFIYTVCRYNISSLANSAWPSTAILVNSRVSCHTVNSKLRDQPQRSLAAILGAGQLVWYDQQSSAG